MAKSDTRMEERVDALEDFVQWISQANSLDGLYNKVQDRLDEAKKIEEG